MSDDDAFKAAQAAALQTGHRLNAVVLDADVVGYVRLMEADEAGTHARLMQLRAAILEPLIGANGGRTVKNNGDGFLAMFESANGAMQAGMSIQRAVMAAEAGIASDRRIAFRMGINITDVIVEEHDIFGDGVNVAARLQSHAEPGGIVISGLVADAVGGTLGMQSVDLGQIHLRHRNEPVRVLSLRFADAPAASVGEMESGFEARPSIAVLPFRKLADPGDMYFADGIVDNIIHALSALKELFVIARGSTLGYGGAEIDARAIGRELGVRYILYGSAQRAGGRLRIATELIDTEAGEVVDAKQYRGDIGDLFDFQDRIAEEVVKAIAPRVRERELRRGLRKRPQAMTAYDLVLQALEPLYQLDYATFSRARGLLQRAMTIDPSYAPAFAYAAYWHIFRVGQEWSMDLAADIQEASRLSARAIACDENDATARSIYGYVQSYLKKDFIESAQSMDLAIHISPNCALAWIFSGATMCFLGDGPSAVARSSTALRLSPLDAHVFFAEHILAQAHYINGDLQESLRLARQADKRNPLLTSNLRTLIASLAAVGQLEEAHAVAKRHYQIAPSFTVSRWAARTPMQDSIRVRRVKELLSAGMPE